MIFAIALKKQNIRKFSIWIINVPFCKSFLNSKLEPYIITILWYHLKDKRQLKVKSGFDQFIGFGLK
jgi:hypothetical protein